MALENCLNNTSSTNYNNMRGNTERDSSFELLRLLAQFFIVFYHMMLITTSPSFLGNVDSLDKVLWIPLHIGVPIFIMISGYFGIHPSIKGLLKLLITVFFYVFATTTILWGIERGEFPFSNLLIVSSSHWFVRTYVYLYLFSPVINAYITRADEKKMIYLFTTVPLKWTNRSLK